MTGLPIIGSYMNDEQTNGSILGYEALPELREELLTVVPAHAPIHDVCLAIVLEVSLHSRRLYTYKITQQRPIASFLEGQLGNRVASHNDLRIRHRVLTTIKAQRNDK